VGDFNGDGIPDLAVANVTGSVGVTILLGNGDGTFRAASAIQATGSQPASIAVGDFNGDGIPDLAVVNTGSDTVTILLGNGDGTFTHSSNSPETGDFPSFVAIGDFNGDGIPDLAVANWGGNTVSILQTITQQATAIATGIAALPAATGAHQVVASYSGDSRDKPSISSNAVSLNTAIGAPAVSVSPSANPTAYGASVTLAIAVTGSGATPTGSVTLQDGSTGLGGRNLSNGLATYSTSVFGVGAHSITAEYSGDSNYMAATSPVLNLAVNKGTPTVSLSGPSSSVAVGAPVTLTATLTGGGFTPSGTVTFLDGTNALGMTQAISGVAAFATSTLALGPHSITASYGGDGNYNSAASTAVNVSVGMTATPTVTVTPSLSSITTVQPLTVTVAVTGGNGNPTPTGSVTLSSGSYGSTATPLVNGSAPIVVAAGSLAVGSDTLTASYTPDANSSATYNSATGTSMQVTVTLATQTITFPAILTQTVGTLLTLSATANSGLAVSFTSTTTGICTVSGTTATFIASGACTIGASQAGNAVYAPAAQVQQSFAVNSEAQTITFANPGAQTVGTPLTLSATANSGLAVSFTSTTTSICTVSGTTATFIASGACTIGANQAGNAVYAPAPQVQQSFSVNPEPSFVVGGGSSPVSIAPGALTGNTAAITVTPSNGFTGSVTLTCSITPVAASDPPTCTLTPSSLTFAGNGAQGSVLTVFTTAATSATTDYKKLLWPAAGTALALLLFGIPRRRRNWLALLGVVALAVTFGAIGCGGSGSGGGGGGGGGGNAGTTAGTYTVTVTGTSGAMTGTVGTVTLTVQ